MKEAVIFSDPQDVTILATRKGELTQIPGSEFRAPITPFGATIFANWVKPYNSLGRLELTTDKEVSVQIHGLYYQDAYGHLLPCCVPDPLSSYTLWTEENFVPDNKHETIAPPALEKHIFWKKHPKSRVAYPPQSGDLHLLIEIKAYSAVENIELGLTDIPELEDEQGYFGKVTMPELYGAMAWIKLVNPEWDDAGWGY